MGDTLLTVVDMENRRGEGKYYGRARRIVKYWRAKAQQPSITTLVVPSATERVVVGA
jgi:hypothetical protein